MPRPVPVRVVAAAAGMAAATAAFAALGHPRRRCGPGRCSRHAVQERNVGIQRRPRRGEGQERALRLRRQRGRRHAPRHRRRRRHVRPADPDGAERQDDRAHDGRDRRVQRLRERQRNALHNVIGLGTSTSNKYAGKWLSFPTSNTGLAQLVAGLLKSQVDSELGLDSPYTYGADATVNGQQAVAIKGEVSTSSGGKVTEVLYIPTSGKPLPIQEVTNPGSTSSSSIHGTVSFANWGENAQTRRRRPSRRHC